MRPLTGTSRKREDPGLTADRRRGTGAGMTKPPKERPSATAPRAQAVYTLVVEVGRKTGDGLPAGCTGAGLLCYASGVDEAEAVRETVAILKQAGMAVLEVEGLGTLEERLEAGDEIDEGERALMERALAENAVIVAQMTPFDG